MKFFLILLMLSLSANTTMKELYAFTKQTKVNEWRRVNDDVMGGISTCALALNDAGHGQFSGHVSLAYNGGFASIQLNKTINIASEYRFIVLRVKGDRKSYEFRLKGSLDQAESYVHPFTTSGEWENIKIALSDFYPQFRGRKLNIPNFNFNSIEQISFLIANKQEEDFALLIDWIALE